MSLHCCSFDQTREITWANNIPNTIANCRDDPNKPLWFDGVNSFISIGEITKDSPDPIPLRNLPRLICNSELEKAISADPTKKKMEFIMQINLRPKFDDTLLDPRIIDDINPPTVNIVVVNAIPLFIGIHFSNPCLYQNVSVKDGNGPSR